MRLLSALMFAAVTALAGAASAQTVQPISFSPAFEEKVHDELGAREGRYLSELVTRRVHAAIERRGAGGSPISIEISIVDARPNRPTLEQAVNQPGLDTFRSVSVGGAELRAVLRDANGGVISEVEHRYFTNSLDDLRHQHPWTWSDAQRSINVFAVKVADAYAAAG